MNIKPELEFAQNRLNDFIENNIHEYANKRNFDFGPENRSNISYLSPFISHRLLFEYDIAKKVLSKFPYLKVEKFIQEIFWRTYWKGWLELRPDVWSDYKLSLDDLDKDDRYREAIEGRTNIDCFNDWVHELKSKNYLHNHARMWFASIWIFTLGLPWQLGAQFFLEHLYDGDAASNTLSWKWVAGLQTKGKHYIARPDNIQKFTNGRYNNIKLKTSMPPLTDQKDYFIKDQSFHNFEKKYDSLIVLDTDLYLDEEMTNKYSKIYLIENRNDTRVIKLSDNVSIFKTNLLKSISSHSEKISIMTSDTLESLFKNEQNFDVIYPFVGENLDYLRILEASHDLNLNILFRKEDTFCWEFSNKGYFNFKKNIPKIISKFLV